MLSNALRSSSRALLRALSLDPLSSFSSSKVILPPPLLLPIVPSLLSLCREFIRFSCLRKEGKKEGRFIKIERVLHRAWRYNLAKSHCFFYRCVEMEKRRRRRRKTVFNCKSMGREMRGWLLLAMWSRWSGVDLDLMSGKILVDELNPNNLMERDFMRIFRKSWAWFWINLIRGFFAFDFMRVSVAIDNESVI